jgi:hypothetical protein
VENAQSVISAPELTPVEGIVAIRKIVGQWLRPEGSRPREAIASVAQVLLSVSVPVLAVTLTQRQEVAKGVFDTLRDIEALAVPDEKAATHLTGLTPQKVDIVTHLEKMIEEACHKPGEWRAGRDGAGSIDGMTFTEVYDLQIGALRQWRDALLAIEAVNALPELIERVRGAEKAAQAADNEVTRLQDLMRHGEGIPWRDLVNERVRQISEKGYTHQHDDEHSYGEIALAAADYAMPDQYPDAASWAFQKSQKPRREQLVKAGALIIAEIERLDRLDPEKTLA